MQPHRRLSHLAALGSTCCQRRCCSRRCPLAVTGCRKASRCWVLPCICSILPHTCCRSLVITACCQLLVIPWHPPRMLTPLACSCLLSASGQRLGPGIHQLFGTLEVPQQPFVAFAVSTQQPAHSRRVRPHGLHRQEVWMRAWACQLSCAACGPTARSQQSCVCRRQPAPWLCLLKRQRAQLHECGPPCLRALPTCSSGRWPRCCSRPPRRRPGSCRHRAATCTATSGQAAAARAADAPAPGAAACRAPSSNCFLQGGGDRWRKARRRVRLGHGDSASCKEAMQRFGISRGPPRFRHGKQGGHVALL